jgi:hypothetical protein
VVIKLHMYYSTIFIFEERTDERGKGKGERGKEKERSWRVEETREE